MRFNMRSKKPLTVRQSGFTIVELIMVMLIIGVLVSTGVFLMMHMMQNSVFLSNKLNAEMAGQDLMDTMIDGYQSEGYARVKGLRFSKEITAISANSITFVNTDNQNVQFAWDSLNKRINRFVNGGAAEKIPYYLPSDMYIDEAGTTAVFIYYDANLSLTSNPADVRGVRITFRVRSGSGNFQDWQHRVDFLSGVAVKKFQ